jgi:hypothetical protein
MNEGFILRTVSFLIVPILFSGANRNLPKVSQKLLLSEEFGIMSHRMNDDVTLTIIPE